MASINFLTQYQLFADPDERLLICCRPKCGFALSVARSQLTPHLREKHDVPNDLRKRLTHYLKHDHPFPFCDPSTVPPRPDGSPVHLRLQEFEGHNCRECGHRTVNRLIMDWHITKEHLYGKRVSREEIDNLYNDVFLQTWTFRAHRADQQYWIMEKNGSLTRPVIGQATYDHLQSMYKREHKRLELHRRDGLCGQKTGPQTLVASRPYKIGHYL
jgi:Orsellinic acid/F9775 biosynthesis cluster protein D